MELGILQETKLPDGINNRGSSGYSVVATDALIQHHGRFAVFYWSEPHLAVEAIHQFGTNVVGFQLATGERRWYIVGCYLAPDDTLMIESIVSALKEKYQGAKLLATGYFNTKLLKPEGDWREEEIAATLAAEGL